MKEKHILIIAATALSFAFIVLAFREAYLANPEHHDWWSLSFVSQDAQDGSFTVSNFGTTKTFFCEVLEVLGGDTLAKPVSFAIDGAGKQTIAVQNPDGKPIRITVWTEGDVNKESKDLSKKKSIYKR